jgi:fructose 1,6-bisphosphatase
MEAQVENDSFSHQSDTVGYLGHTDAHPRMLKAARARLSTAASDGLPIDFRVNRWEISPSSDPHKGR